MQNIFIRLRRSLTSRLRGLAYLTHNLWASRSLKPIPSMQVGDYTITGLRRNQINELGQLHRQLRNGRPLSYWRRTLLKYKGAVFCGVVADQNGKLLGFHLSQFLKRDFKRGIVHLEFAGLLPEARGKGLAGASRLHIIQYCLANGIKGISATVRTDNLAALKSSERLGYKVIENRCNGRLVKIYWDLEELKKYV